MSNETSPLEAHRKNVLGWTQGELAERLETTQATISRWEAGQVPPDRVIQVERITGIHRSVLRPDLYAEAAQ